MNLIKSLLGWKAKLNWSEDLCFSKKLSHSPIDLADVLPRLWPYLDHSTSSVRKATLQTLRTLTRPLVTTTEDGVQLKINGNGQEAADKSEKMDEDSQDNGMPKLEIAQYLMWTPELLQEAMRHIYQRVLFEHVHEIQEVALQVKLCCPELLLLIFTKLNKLSLWWFEFIITVANLKLCKMLLLLFFVLVPQYSAKNH